LTKVVINKRIIFSTDCVDDKFDKFDDTNVIIKKIKKINK